MAITVLGLGSQLWVVEVSIQRTTLNIVSLSASMFLALSPSAMCGFVLASATGTPVVARPAVPQTHRLVEHVRVLLHAGQAEPVQHQPRVRPPLLRPQPVALANAQPGVGKTPNRIVGHTISVGEGGGGVRIRVLG